MEEKYKPFLMRFWYTVTTSIGPPVHKWEQETVLVYAVNEGQAERKIRFQYEDAERFKNLTIE